MDLSTSQECSDAVNYVMSFNNQASYRYSSSFDYNPKGCFMFDYGAMYFNWHANGVRRSDAASICKKGNT